MHAAERNGVPPEAFATYGRWWQLESWLRSLVRLELMAAKGPGWTRPIEKAVLARARGDEVRDYMASADKGDVLAHVDTSVLNALILDNYELFSPVLLRERGRWDYRFGEALHIRNRIAHCRRPHVDDLSRLEQLLRDLSPGARRAADHYNDWWPAERGIDDPVVQDWVGLRHEDAARLVPHGRTNKGIQFRLMYSVRPWLQEHLQPEPPLTGTPGVVWGLHVWLEEGTLDLAAYWNYGWVRQASEYVIHVLSDSPISIIVTLPAVADAANVSNAITQLFEPIFHSRVREYAARPMEDAARERHRQVADSLDGRVLTDHIFSTVDRAAPPLDLFGA